MIVLESLRSVPATRLVSRLSYCYRAALKSVQRYKLPRYRDLAHVFFFWGIFGIGIGIGMIPRVISFQAWTGDD